MWIVLALALIVAATITAAVIRRHRSATPRVLPYGELREQIMDESARSTEAPPLSAQRPTGLDMRLPAASAAEFRAVNPPTEQNWSAVCKCYDAITGSIHKELLAINNRIDAFDHISPARRDLILVEALEREVNNGGFDQFFLNSSGDGAALTPAALRNLGQEEAANLVDRANAQFPGGPPADRAKRLAQMKLLGGPARNVWFELDNEFYKLKLPFGGLAIGAGFPFILTHESEFFLPK